jgi:hypothetical protein
MAAHSPTRDDGLGTNSFAVDGNNNQRYVIKNTAPTTSHGTALDDHGLPLPVPEGRCVPHRARPECQGHRQLDHLQRSELLNLANLFELNHR